jgi:hypothetical protein
MASSKRRGPPVTPDIQGVPRPDRFKPQPTMHTGKGSRVDHLPSRHARDVITGADPMSRAMGQFGKQSPYKIG